MFQDCDLNGTPFLIVSKVLSYEHREVFTFCYLAATTWPAFYGMDFVRQKKYLVATWVLSCAVMSTFTLLPAIKTESIDLMQVCVNLIARTND